MIETVESYQTPVLMGLSLLFFGLGFTYLWQALGSIKRVRMLRAMRKLVLSLIFVPLALTTSFVLIGIQGFETLTKEEEIARLRIEPESGREFYATLTFADGREQRFLLTGDEVQVDADILKWRPYAHYLGLHTHYDLNRISGRFRNVSDVQRYPPSVYSLSSERYLDLVKFRNQYSTLSYLFDAEYGSATFIKADQPATYSLRVSTTGLLLRPVKTP
ncbi:hypothetical protein [Pleionea litopenaei]|uniref:Cation/multidrug efflux pump n=1 Tax=Pleionea litopenaei TaxID=3070815 RepID=A0AA51RWZ0_9GAMM|nr:hypothetical protein [Pleionea sp. HL-JVS1]WMS89045.1 hypothetical protein Q9312_09045 [Pleionea sp. HL-JVS1]